MLAGKLENQKKRILLALFGVVVFVSASFAQSTDLGFPTPVSTDQITGRIRARDIGDSRLTTHYFVFETGTGDVLLNIETSNLNGDIDVYTAGSLKPLLKASVYALGYATVIQRQVYLRLPSRLILRVEGRTPNDDAANYAITFGGVFKPIAASAVPRDPGTPRVTGSGATAGARERVSSVGTIIEEIKPPAPPVQTPKETAATTGRNTVGNANTSSNSSKGSKSDSSPSGDTSPVRPVLPKNAGANNRAAVPVKPKSSAPANGSASKTSPAAAKNTTATAKTSTPGKPKTTAPATPPKSAPDPLAGVSLVLDMKDGSREKYSMTDVLRVNVDKTVVTIVLKNGEIHRLSLLDIAEMKIGQ